MPTAAIDKIKEKYNEYPDDMFKDTRMSLGEHIEELRYRLLNALKVLLFFLLIGFVLDAVGGWVGNEKIGVGKPMLKVITEPVEVQTRDFYYRRTMKLMAEKVSKIQLTDSADVVAIRQKLKDNDYNIGALNSDERMKLLGAPVPIRTIIDMKQFEPAFGPMKPDSTKELAVTLQMYPAELSSASDTGALQIESKQYLATLSAQEAFVVYFKVSLMCGVVLACPFIFYQFWAFVGAGLYPHEKKYVYLFFGPSILLFIGGVFLCQFVVLPGAVKALLKFNEMLGFDPDIRLGEWLSLAIILPLVFGISFQTPLVMVFLNRIGIFTAADYLSKWRYACIILAFFAAMITPTPDAITMLYLFAPMFGLYMVGILICHMFPGFDPDEDQESEAAEEVAV